MTNEPLPSHCPIVIAGGGSVGLSLAAELGWRGIRCLVVEERNELNDHPRANAVANRTMEYYRRWGIDQAITDAGIPPTLPAEYLWVTSLAGREIHRISLPPFDELVAQRKQSGYANDEHNWSPYLKTITGQDEVERALFEYVQTLDTVDFRFGACLRDFSQDSESVHCTVEDVASGQTSTVTACYLAACDGGRSIVRRKLGIELSGNASLAKFVSIYFRAPEMINSHWFGHGNIFFPLHRQHRGFLLTWDEDQTYTYHRVLDEGQHWSDVDPVATIHAVVGKTFEVEVLSVQPWTAHALVADEYVRGRVALVGDAAHLFSPTGGFGMNTGVSDAIDLAWKLQASLEGWAGSGLLASYDAERRPIGVRNTAEAADCFHRLFAVMQHGDELDEDSHSSERLRAELKADLKDQEKLISSSGTLLGYRYEGSHIVVPDNTKEPDDDPRRYAPVARPGHRAPHIWLSNGDALYDRLGRDFTLIQFGEKPVDAGAFIDYAACADMPLEVVHVAEPQALELYESDLVLIRPDLMIAWRKRAEDYDAASILDTARGAWCAD